MSDARIDRRRALAMLGAAGVGTAVLGACGGSDNGDAAPATSTPTTGRSGTTTGGAGTGGSGSASGIVTAESFENAASCTVTPQQTEGPYYIDVDKIRSDIREDRQGIQLRVAARVMGTDGCTPVRDAVFEIWHCDAGGLYSGFEQASQGGGGPGGGGASGQSDDKRYLRGAQVTNADGIAEITTVYPGWYRGRTVHVHAKVLLSNRDVLTTQLYFDDDLTQTVYARAPYSARSGRDTFNSDDGIFRSATTMTVSKDGDGYLGLMTIGIST